MLVSTSNNRQRIEFIKNDIREGLVSDESLEWLENYKREIEEEIYFFLEDTRPYGRRLA